MSGLEYLDADDLVLLMADNQITSGNDQLRLPENMPLDEVEKKSILEVVNACGGNKSEAARRLGITRKTLRKKLDKYKKVG